MYSSSLPESYIFYPAFFSILSLALTEPLFKIHRRHAARKTQGCYRELMPTLEYVKQEQKQEKPSIRDQLKAVAKTQPEKKSPVKSKTHDMEL